MFSILIYLVMKYNNILLRRQNKLFNTRKESRTAIARLKEAIEENFVHIKYFCTQFLFPLVRFLVFFIVIFPLIFQTNWW